MNAETETQNYEYIPRFRKWEIVRDKVTGREGYISKNGNKQVWVTYPNSYFFMSRQVAYPKKTAHLHIEHIKGSSGMPARINLRNIKLAEEATP